MSQVGCGVFAGVVGTRVNGQGSAPVSTLEPLSDTFFSLASRSEDARWILDACSEVGNFKGAPVNERHLFPKLRLRAGNERDMMPARHRKNHRMKLDLRCWEDKAQNSCWFQRLYQSASPIDRASIWVLTASGYQAAFKLNLADCGVVWKANLQGCVVCGQFGFLLRVDHLRWVLLETRDVTSG
jgi:hypothetical protein